MTSRTLTCRRAMPRELRADPARRDPATPPSRFTVPVGVALQTTRPVGRLASDRGGR
jgi:hypothetical protein